VIKVLNGVTNPLKSGLTERTASKGALVVMRRKISTARCHGFVSTLPVQGEEEPETDPSRVAASVRTLSPDGVHSGGLQPGAAPPFCCSHESVDGRCEHALEIASVAGSLPRYDAAR
jgi:hypothetical protein